MESILGAESYLSCCKTDNFHFFFLVWRRLVLEDIIIVFRFLKDYQGENILYRSKQHNY